MSTYCVLLSHAETGEIKDIELKAKNQRKAIARAMRVVGNDPHNVYHVSRINAEGDAVTPLPQNRELGTDAVVKKITVNDVPKLPSPPPPGSRAPAAKPAKTFEFSSVVTMDLLVSMGHPAPRKEEESNDE
jgi:hypothetical protein